MNESQLPHGQTVVTAHQHGTNDSGGLRQRRSAQRKAPKGETKGAFEPGRTRRLGRLRENLPPRRRCRKRHRWPVNESNLRVKRRDPWRGANEQPKAVADLALSGEDAKEITGVSLPGSQAGGATTSRSELKSLTQNSVPQGAGRPCYEAENSACRGE